MSFSLNQQSVYAPSPSIFGPDLQMIRALRLAVCTSTLCNLVYSSVRSFAMRIFRSLPI